MNTYTNDLQNLKDVLQQQHTHLIKMLDILRQEHQALSENDLERFENIVQQKHQQVKMLEQIQPRLDSVEQMIGGVLSKSTFAAFIQRMPEGAAKSGIKGLWQDFQTTLEECNLQNKTNNRILSASAINVKQALNILRGNPNQPGEGIYGKSGRQQDSMHSHSLAIA